MPSYNLVDEPWIPCLMLASQRKEEFGLKETLLRAHEIRELFDPSPLVTVALHRLLLAVLHRNFGPPNEAAWQQMWEKGHFDAATLNAYFERWRDRFDLFDERRPFYQIARTVSCRPISMAKLAHELASGNNPTLFDHTLDATPPAFTPAQAARYLVAFQCFALPGLLSRESEAEKSARAAPLAKGAVALFKGGNLFETLMLNLHKYSPADGEPFDAQPDDRPAWECDEESCPEERYPRGYLDLLSWQSRCVRLQPEADEDGRVLVRRATAIMGFQIPDGFQLRGKETMIAFAKREKAKGGEEPWPPISFQQDQAIWRDSLCLFQSIEGRQARPKTITWLSDLAAEGIIGMRQTLPLELFGLCAERAKVSLWRHERLPVPLAYLCDEALVRALATALQLAEDVAQAVGWGSKALARMLLAPGSADRGGRQPKERDVGTLANSFGLSRLYWSALEVPFRQLLVDLANDREVSEDGQVVYGGSRLPEWARTLRRAAEAAFASAVSGLDGVPRSTRAVAIAERDFRRNIGGVFHKYSLTARR